MNRRGQASLKLWLLGAAAIAIPSTLGIFGPDGVAFADGKLSFGTNAKKPAVKVSTAVATEPPRLLPVPDANTSSIQTVSDSQPLLAAGSGQKSEVMKQLELLYEKDGKEMPELQTIQAVPIGGTPAATPANPGTAAAAGQQPNGGTQPLRTQGANGPRATPSTTTVKPTSPESTSPPSKNPVTSFFKKLMPGNKDKDPKPVAAGPNYQPNVAPNPPNAPTGTTRPQEYKPAQVRTAQAPKGPGYATNPTAQRPPAPATSSPPLTQQPEPLIGKTAPALSGIPTQPAFTFGGPPPSPSTDFGAELAGTSTAALPPLLTQPQLILPEPPAAVPAADESPVPKPTGNTNLEAPFTEMSEDEADGVGSVDPFTGLTLEDDANVPAESAKDSKAVAPPKVAAPNEAADSSDPFADELRKLGILPPVEQKAAFEEEAPKLTLPALTPPALKEISPALEGLEDEATRNKMLKIRERGGMKGLKGFCPVTLHDERELVDAKPDFHATHRGQKFHFASAEAKSKFEEDPSLYAPAAYGADVVALTRDKDVVEGSLDHAAWFKGRLYLFGSEDAHDTFVTNHVQYATPAGIE